MININKRMKIAGCVGVIGAVAGYLLDAYIQMVVSNQELHFLFGYVDGVIVMGLIMIYMQHYSTTHPIGGN